MSPPITSLCPSANKTQFIDTAHTIPDVGTLDMEWIPNDALGGIQSGGTDTGVDGGIGGGKTGGAGEGEAGNGDGEGDGEGDATSEAGDVKGEKVDEDMDVAEDEDQWL